MIAGLDKFVYFLTDWQQYLTPLVFRMTGITPRTFMYLAGIVEIAAGILVAVKPRYGAYIVAVWLWAIIVNLLLIPDFYDVALRDFGLSIGALALVRLSKEFDYSRV